MTCVVVTKLNIISDAGDPFNNVHLTAFLDAKVLRLHIYVIIMSADIMMVHVYFIKDAHGITFI